MDSSLRSAWLVPVGTAATAKVAACPARTSDRSRAGRLCAVMSRSFARRASWATADADRVRGRRCYTGLLPAVRFSPYAAALLRKARSLACEAKAANPLVMRCRALLPASGMIARLELEGPHTEQPHTVSYGIASGSQYRRQPSVVMVNEMIHSRWR